MFNLQEFRNKFQNGGARPSQFEMQVIWPAAVRGTAGVAAAERDFSFLCNMAQIPKSEIGVMNVPYFGRTMKFAGDRKFEDLNVTVLNDEDYKVRHAIEAWMKAIRDHATTTSVFNGGIDSGSYVTDGVVKQFSPNNGGAPLHAYKFVGMFPTLLGDIKLSWAAEGQVEEFTVTFAYQWWEAVNASTGAAL